MHEPPTSASGPAPGAQAVDAERASEHDGGSGSLGAVATRMSGRGAGRSSETGGVWADDLVLADGDVILRRWRTDDADAVRQSCQDPEIARWIPVIPYPYRLADAVEFLAEVEEEWRTGSSRAFAIVDRQDRLLGAVTLHGPEGHLAEIGYWLDPTARGRGVATRAVRLLTRYAFEADPVLVRIGLRTLAGNVASGAVARRAGFTFEGVLRSLEPVRGALADVVVYSLLRSESDRP